jgi:hypothetical protein
MRVAVLCTVIAVLSVAAGSAQSGPPQTVPLESPRWTASDSIRFTDWLGQPSVYINRGVALASGVELRNGTIDFDIAATDKSENMGVAFHGRDLNHYEVIFFRAGSSGTIDAMQYSPGLNSLAVAWQIFYGDGANAVVDVPRDRWRHVSVRLRGHTADVYLDHGKDPALTVPHLVVGRDGGGAIGIWAGAFGTGTYVSNLQYAVDPAPHPIPVPVLPAGTIANWQLSQAFDASTQTPGTLPELATLTWDSVHAESPGLVLINRYRKAPIRGAPDNIDSVLTGRVPGSKVVYARTVIKAPRAGLRRMQVGFSDGLVVYCNGVPLYWGMHPAGFRDLGIMTLLGDAVYLPLKPGQNEIVFAVTEFFGGWAFSGRLDQQAAPNH